MNGDGKFEFGSLAKDRDGRFEFENAVAWMGHSVAMFHNRFGIEDAEGIDWQRLSILVEEVGEYASCINRGNDEEKLEELADVVYVALGTLELSGEAGRKALLRVANKNNAKTHDTHEFNPETRKLVKRRR